MWQAYYLITRLASPLARLYLRFYSRFTSTERSRVVLVNQDEEVLLVENVFSHGKWSLPGGGVDGGESCIVAAKRELREELRIDISEDELFFVYKYAPGDTEKLYYEANIYYAVIDKKRIDKTKRQKPEIVDMRWCDIDNICEGATELSVDSIARLPRGDITDKIDKLRRLSERL